MPVINFVEEILLVETCVLNKFYFTSIIEIFYLCVCKTSLSQERMTSVSIAYISLGFAGIVATYLSLIVSSSMITKSSTAVLVSILMLYNILRLSAAAFLSIFSLTNSRPRAQEVCNYMWLLGTFGANYTVLDMTMELLWLTIYPDVTQSLSPVKAVKRTLVVFLLGLLANCVPLVHAIVPIKSSYEERIGGATCDEPQYYNIYNEQYNQYVMPVMHWWLPNLLLFIVIAVILVLKLRRLFGQRRTSRGAPKDQKSQQVFILCLACWNLALEILTLVELFNMFTIRTSQDQEKYTREFLVAESLSLIAAATSPLCLFLWRSYRDEFRRILSRESYKSYPMTSQSMQGFAADTKISLSFL